MNQMQVQSREDYQNKARLWSDYFAVNKEEATEIQNILPLPGKDVLEIGCGNGRLTSQLAPLCQSIVGIDQDQLLLSGLGNNLDNATFLTGSAELLPFADESFDVAIMPWMLHQVSNKTKAVEEAARVLKKGGHLIIFALLSDCDYDRIARHFVPSLDRSIESDTYYSKPVTNALSNLRIKPLSNDNDAFCFLFPNCTVALQAFLFAFEAWYDIRLNKFDTDRLRHLLQQFNYDNFIKLETKGMLYSASKN